MLPVWRGSVLSPAEQQVRSQTVPLLRAIRHLVTALTMAIGQQRWDAS